MWRDLARCSHSVVPGDLMFNAVLIRQARALCNLCPVWRCCLVLPATLFAHGPATLDEDGAASLAEDVPR